MTSNEGGITPPDGVRAGQRRRDGAATTAEVGRSSLPNVRIHFRGGSVVETRAANVRTTRGRHDGKLSELGIEDIEDGWARLPYFRLDAVDAVEWIDR